jgi:hypothetical protein
MKQEVGKACVGALIVCTRAGRIDMRHGWTIQQLSSWSCNYIWRSGVWGIVEWTFLLLGFRVLSIISLQCRSLFLLLAFLVVMPLLGQWAWLHTGLLSCCQHLAFLFVTTIWTRSMNKKGNLLRPKPYRRTLRGFSVFCKFVCYFSRSCSFPG